MATINWNENLSVKIDSIDAQHKKLIELVNSFYDGISRGTTKEKMLGLIKGMKEYTLYHFSTEEEYMKQFGYADFMEHKFEHDKFIDTVLNYEERYRNGKLLLSVEITNFIKEWVSNHILETDKKYVELFVRNGVK
jgi:hemerythrin